jgi:hypothetical protein
MNLFGVRLKHAWEFSAQGVIWRVHPAVNGRLIGEERDLGQKRTSFFCVEQRSGKVLWQNVTVAEPWWVGIALVEKDVLLVHGYATPDMPGQRGLTAIDTAHGTILWSNATWEFAHTTARGFVVLSTSPTATGEIHVDRRTGDSLPSPTPADAPWGLEDASAAMGLSSTQFPVPFDAGAVGDSVALNAAVKRYVRPEISGITEYLTLPHHVVLTTFEHAADKRTGQNNTRVDIRLLDAHTGKEKFSETVAAYASGQIPDTFFSQEGLVFYVKERKTLCAIHPRS